jgi:hypothetical protein
MRGGLLSTQTNLTDILTDILNEPAETMADQYIRLGEVVQFVEDYVLFNIDDLAGEDLDALTFGRLKSVLDEKIQKYGDFRRTQNGRFEKEEDVAKWVRTGVEKRDGNS